MCCFLGEDPIAHLKQTCCVQLGAFSSAVTDQFVVFVMQKETLHAVALNCRCA